MRYFLLIITFLLINYPAAAQVDSTGNETAASAESIANASAQARSVVIDLSNPADAELTLKKIHTFKYLESVILEGDTDESTLQKIIYRLSVLKNLSALSLRDNGIEKIPDAIRNIKTLRSVSIEGNTELDYTDLCTKLSALPVTDLQLTDNGLKKIPPPFSLIKSLQKISISGSDQLNYDNLVDELAKLPGLTGLSIPVNYMTELPKNITKLKSLQLLDVSNNILTDLPSEVSSLKAINNLSIQGNLLLNPVKDLEKFKGNDIQYLSLDKEITGDEVEQIKKMFPNAEISYPVSEKEEEVKEEPANKEAAPKKEKFTGELKAKKESTILSAAYLSYPGLFQGLQYNFDTLSFEERFMNLRYSNVFQNVNNGWNGGNLYLSKRRFWRNNFKRRHQKWFYINEPAGLNNYPELRSFSSMYWIYEGPLSKRKFRKTYLRRWNDIRIEYEKNNSLFTINLKCDTGFVNFNAYPVIAGLPIEKSRQAYNRSFLIYQKTLARRSQSFKRDLAREKKKYDANFKKLQAYAWKELQLRMSDEEKSMSRDEWLDYYDQIIGNEQQALNNSALTKGFVMRSLALNRYFNGGMQTFVNRPGNLPPNPNDYAGKTVSVDFMNAAGTLKLPVVNIILLDNKNKRYTEIPGSLGLSPSVMILKPYSSYSIIVELRNGDFGLVTSAEIDSHTLEANKSYSFKTIVVDKNLGTIGDLLKGSGIH